MKLTEELIGKTIYLLRRDWLTREPADGAFGKVEAVCIQSFSLESNSCVVAFEEGERRFVYHEKSNFLRTSLHNFSMHSSLEEINDIQAKQLVINYITGADTQNNVSAEQYKNIAKILGLRVGSSLK